MDNEINILIIPKDNVLQKYCIGCKKLVLRSMIKDSLLYCFKCERINNNKPIYYAKDVCKPYFNI